MDNHDYKPNSHKYREEGKSDVPAERKKVEKVIKGSAKTRKKSEIRKFTDIFVAEDVSDVKSYLIDDLLIPSIKNTILDLIIEGATIIFKGEPGRNRKGGSSVDYVSYSRYASKDRRDDRRYSEPKSRTSYNYDDITLESRGEAEKVLNCMDELIDNYGFVTVADLYDLVGKTCNYTDNNYGWTNLRGAEPVRVRGGEYLLRLPKAWPID